jgi:Uma2 family endonuclease
MATVTRIGPADHGRPMTLEDFQAAPSEEGYQYELIDGKLYVSPVPDLPEGRIEQWAFGKLFLYAMQRPDVINYVHPKSRIFVPVRLRTTCPEPDVSAYHDFPLQVDYREVRWQDVSPLVVVEVISVDDPGKDLVRNVELYLQVPSIREFWLFDSRENANTPDMLVYRRRGQRWQRPIEVGFGETYTTRLFPDFSLLLDPHR